MTESKKKDRKGKKKGNKRGQKDKGGEPAAGKKKIILSSEFLLARAENKKSHFSLREENNLRRFQAAQIEECGQDASRRRSLSHGSD